MRLLAIEKRSKSSSLPEVIFLIEEASPGGLIKPGLPLKAPHSLSSAHILNTTKTVVRVRGLLSML